MLDDGSNDFVSRLSVFRFVVEINIDDSPVGLAAKLSLEVFDGK